MSNEEIVHRIQQGEELYHELWERLEKFVAMKAGQVYRQNTDYSAADFEDYYQSGYLAMVKAAESYEPDKGATFIYWLDFYLRQAFASVGGFRSLKDKASPLRYAMSIDAAIEGTDGVELIDSIPAPGNDMEDVEERIFQAQLHDELETAIATLPEEEQVAIRGRFYEGRSLKEAGRQEVHKALIKLRKPKIRKRLVPYIDQITCFYRPSGVSRFKSTHTSSVEEIVFWRDEHSPY
ncbi:sigma-70 family RNA polymerase sigma factor [Clostridiaceae bacterium OttesenSCG-928-D20]|nr:sigma-70 family RNA polymerase sigma factor [Clostridiaceae bacterium OttesenSCG-928-D20]